MVLTSSLMAPPVTIHVWVKCQSYTPDSVQVSGSIGRMDTLPRPARRPYVLSSQAPNLNYKELCLLTEPPPFPAANTPCLDTNQFNSMHMCRTFLKAGIRGQVYALSVDPEEHQMQCGPVLQRQASVLGEILLGSSPRNFGMHFITTSTCWNCTTGFWGKSKLLFDLFRKFLGMASAASRRNSKTLSPKPCIECIRCRPHQVHNQSQLQPADGGENLALWVSRSL